MERCYYNSKGYCYNRATTHLHCAECESKKREIGYDALKEKHLRLLRSLQDRAGMAFNKYDV